MKLIYTMLKSSALALIMLVSGTVFAQTNYGQLRGTTKDAVSNTVVDFATVRLEQSGRFVDGTYSNMDGEFTFSTLTPGEYQLIVTHMEYDTARLTVSIASDSYIFREIKMRKGGSNVIIPQADVSGDRYGRKLIEQDDNKVTLTETEIKRLPTRNLGAIADLTAGVNQTRDGVSFRGSRADGTAYFIDGVRVIGSVGQTQAAQGQISIYQSGIPAQFGDFTGGAISVTTRGPSRNHQGSFEFISSTPTEFFKLTGDKFDNDNRFDKANRFDFNQAEFFASGPLLIKGKGATEKVVLGYMVAGNASYTRDPRPSFVGVYKVNDEKLNEIETNPLVPNVDGGLVHAGNYLTLNDLENVRVRPNSARNNGNLQFKVDFVPNRNINLSFYGSGEYVGGPSVNNSIMNYDLNAMSDRLTVRSYLRFTQKFGSSGKDTVRKNRTTLSNAYYSVRVDYQNTFSRTYDPIHGDNIFDYGYIGRFERFTSPNFNYIGDLNNPDAPSRMFIDQNGDTVYLRNFWEQSGFRDTAYKFTRAEDVIPGERGKNMNPLRANYTNNLYNFFSERNTPVINEFQILQGQGLINGLNPPNVYSLWATPGSVTANFSQGQSERVTVFAMTEAQLKGPSRGNKSSTPHDLQFGFMYEQNAIRSFGLNATRLWFLMPQLMNSHINELDRSNPILSYDENGVFLDTVRYNRFVNESQQTNFDKNFRSKLISEGRTDANGNPVRNNSFVEVNSFTPDDLDLNMFNANELLNNGASLVSYYGYDHLGNVRRGKPSVEDFTNDPANRQLGAFQPVYFATWFQDKFAYKDIIFRLGLRVERYNANQLVLADPYSLYPVRERSEVSELNGNAVNHPSNMGEDYKVYVNDVNNPTRILGYRDGDQWYDEGGNEIQNAEIISNKTNNGRIAPYLVDPTRQQISRTSFRDYTPEWNFLPRVYFSFPIRNNANFYASFDVLAQRPLTGASFLTIDNYFFMDQRNSGAFANPDLNPRIKTEYQIGFKQMIGTSSALEIGAYYAEIKNDIQLFQYNQAYPVTYLSYQNIDFSTIKGFSTEYQLMGRHVSLRANYNLQFADGTGSNPNAAQALIASGQPNLRTLFPLGDLDIRHQVRMVFNYDFGGPDPRDPTKNNYAGPDFAKKIFENMNANMVLSANSGLPYTQTNVPTQIGSADRANIKGTPFGSRLPWQYNVDMNLSKNVLIKRGKTAEGVAKKPISANVFMWVTNIFNIERVSGVYSYTGQPTDDGFINSPRGQQAVSEQLSAQSYTDLYRVLVNNPNNFLSPRFARLGVRFQF